jgi:outer membrane lipoprotein-sorting protein
MEFRFTHRTSHPIHLIIFGVFNYRKWSGCSLYVGILSLALVMGCAPLKPAPPARPFSQDETARLISRMRARGDKVFSFLGIGKVRYNEGEGEGESNLLVVGSRPYRARFEITHPWGKPLFYIVNDGEHISVLSFVDHRFYIGQPSQFHEERFFLFDLDLGSAWMMLSGMVPILPHARAMSLKPDEITLYSWQDEVVEVITFSSNPLLPSSVHLPTQGITAALSKFKQGTIGPYPSRIRISQGDERDLEIRYTSLQLNTPIPEEVFRLDPPPGFEIIELNGRR